MGMPQLRPRYRRARTAKANPAKHNPTPTHCSVIPGWSGSEWLMEARRPASACLCKGTTTMSTPTRIATRRPQPAHSGVLRLAFLLNCASTSQHRTNAAQSQPMSARGPGISASVAEVVELQRQVDLRAAQQLDRRLQIVALLAGDADLLALDAGLDLELRVLDEARYLPAGLGIDALPEEHLLTGRGEVDLGLLDVEAGEVDAALAEAQFEDLEHLLRLKI